MKVVRKLLLRYDDFDCSPIPSSPKSGFNLPQVFKTYMLYFKGGYKEAT